MTDAIEKTIEIAAPVERVWLAVTDHIEFGEWFGVRIDAPFVAGEISRGRITYPGYEHLEWEVTIGKMEAPHYFSFTWHPYAVNPAIDYSGETPTLVEFRLESIPPGTRLVVTESGFDKIPPHRRPDALRMNDSGWEEEVGNVKTYVER